MRQAPIGGVRLRHWLIAVVAIVVAACIAAGAYALWPVAHPKSVRSAAVPGQQVTLDGGLRLTVPPHGDWSGEYHTGADESEQHDFGVRIGDSVVLVAPSGNKAGLNAGTVIEAMTFTDARGWDAKTAAWSEPPPVAFASADGSTQVRWRASAPNRALIVATMPDGKTSGLFFLSPGFEPATAAGLHRALRRVWRTLRIEGVSLPPVPSKAKVAKQGVHLIDVAVRVWSADHGGKYPPAKAITADGIWWTEGICGSWPANPWTGRPMKQGLDTGDFTYILAPGGHRAQLILHGEGEKSLWTIDYVPLP